MSRRLVTDEVVEAKERLITDLESVVPSPVEGELKYTSSLFKNRLVLDVEDFGVVEIDFDKYLSLESSYGEKLLQLPSEYVFIDSVCSALKREIDLKKIELLSLDGNIRDEYLVLAERDKLKVTEAAISAYILSHSLHKIAENRIIELEHRRRSLQGLISGIEKLNSNVLELSRKSRRGLDKEE